MIGTLQDVETSCGQKTQKRFQDLTIHLDADLASMLAQKLPIHGVRSDTAEISDHLRNMIAVMIDQGLRDRDALFDVNKDLVEEMTNSRQRRKVFDILNKSGFFEVRIGHVPDVRCKARTFINVPMHQLQLYPHIASPFAGAPCLRWAFSGSTVPFFLDGGWRAVFHQSFRAASVKLWGQNCFQFERLILHGLRSLVVLPVTDEELMNIIIRREDNDTATHGKKEKQTTRDEKFACYRRSWGSFGSGTEFEVVRSHGRCYHWLTNQPKELRREKTMLPCKDGQLSPVAERDMSGTYPACIATMALNRFGMTESVARLIADVQSGDIYKKIGHEMGGRYATRSHQQMKKTVSVALFDDARRFGTTPATSAFFRLYRDPATLIAGIRNQPYGVRQLSNKLNEMEGGFFIDIVMPELYRRGILCLPIHDAMMLAEPDGPEAAEIMDRLAVEYFGFQPAFKWA